MLPSKRFTVPGVADEYPVHDTLSERYAHLKHIAFEKFHVIWHASGAVDGMLRIEQRRDRPLKGMRWLLLKDRSQPSRLSPRVTSTLRSPSGSRRSGPQPFERHRRLAADPKDQWRLRVSQRLVPGETNPRVMSPNT
ncbi:MAG: hypothetical protein ABI607_08090 [Betaproteobacteria bacterium]